MNSVKYFLLIFLLSFESVIPPARQENESLVPPKIDFPGSQIYPGIKIKSVQPEFRWSKSEKAKNYFLNISNKDDRGFSDLIYSSEKNGIFKDTSELLSKSVLSDSGEFRWIVRAKVDKDWSGNTNRLYFKTTSPEKRREKIKESPKQFASAKTPIESNNPLTFIQESSSNSFEEIILNFKYAGIINSPITAYYQNGNVLIPLSEIFDLLLVDNTVDKKNKNISGFFIDPEEKYSLDFLSYKAERKDSSYIFTKLDFIEEDFDFFVNTKTLEQIFDFNLAVDFSNLTVTLNSARNLPVLQKYLREKSYTTSNNEEIPEPSTKIIDREKTNLSGGVLDYYLTSTFNKGIEPYNTYQFGAGGELLGGSAQLITNGSYFHNKIYSSETNYLWMYDLEKNDYISKISLGDFSFDGLMPSTSRGVQVTNEPLELRKVYASYQIIDKAPPNYTVELYINNKLMDYTKSDANGNFKFKLPLSYGTTLVQLKYYGPEGEYYTDNKIYQIPFTLLPPKEFNYKISLGKYANTSKNAANLHAEYGITDWLTDQAGVDFIDDPLSSKGVFYNSLTSRISDNYLLNLLTAPNAYYTLSANALYYSQASVSLAFTNYEKNPVYNPAKLDNEFSALFFVPLESGFRSYNVNGGFRYARSSNLKRYDYSLGALASFGGFSPTINYNLIQFDYGNEISNRSIISPGFLLTIPGLSSALTFLSGNIINSRLNYNLTDNKFENFNISFSASIFKHGRIQISHQQNFLSSISHTQVQLIIELPFTRSYTSVSENSFSQSIQGAILYDDNYDKFNFMNRQQLGKSAVAMRMFLDENADGKYDNNEPLIKKGKVVLDNAGTMERSEDNILRIGELSPYTKYRAKIVESSIDNPLWVPKYKSILFSSGPNKVRPIDIPFYVSGEIDGTVTKIVDNQKAAVAGMKVHIDGIENDMNITTNTFSDGSFYYFGLAPGKYKIYLNQSQLSFLGLQSDPTFKEIDLKPDGIINFDFILSK